MKFFLTIVMLAIFANMGLTTILDNALAQMQNPNQQQIPQPQRQTDHPNPQQPPSPNDWGEIISGQAQAVGGMGGHSSNPLPDEPGTLPQDIDRETPRGGVGNQEDEKHPAFHANALCPASGLPGCVNLSPYFFLFF